WPRLLLSWMLLPIDLRLKNLFYARNPALYPSCASLTEVKADTVLETAKIEPTISGNSLRSVWPAWPPVIREADSDLSCAVAAAHELGRTGAGKLSTTELIARLGPTHLISARRQMPPRRL